MLERFYKYKEEFLFVANGWANRRCAILDKHKPHKWIDEKHYDTAPLVCPGSKKHIYYRCHSCGQMKKC